MNKDDICVSVAIMTYNHRNFIAQAIDGALMQETTFPYEIIIGEDESQDGTREICLEYANRYPDKICLFLRSREDVIYIDGTATGRFNLVETMKAACGKYIALCDGDDYWTDPHKLQKQVDFLEAHPDYVIACHDVMEIYEGESQPPRRLSYSPDSVSRTLEDILTLNFIPTVSVMFRNQLFTEFPKWFNNLPMGDWSLHILNACHGKIWYMADCMAVYRKHKGGVWSSQSHISLLENNLNLYQVVKEFLNGQYDLTIHAAVARTHLEIATEYFKSDRIQSADEHYSKFWQSLPFNSDKAQAWPLWIIANAIAVESAMGEESAIAFIKMCIDKSPEKQRKSISRLLLSRWYHLQAFRAFQGKEMQDVRKYARRGVLSNPLMLFNRGFISIFLQSIIGEEVWKRGQKLISRQGRS